MPMVAKPHFPAKVYKIENKNHNMDFHDPSLVIDNSLLSSDKNFSPIGLNMAKLWPWPSHKKHIPTYGNAHLSKPITRCVQRKSNLTES